MATKKSNDTIMQVNPTAKERYLKLKEKREKFVDRAQECSELTISSFSDDTIAFIP